MNPVREFRSIAQRHLEAKWALFPQEASNLGLHQFDADLGENDAELWLSYGKLVACDTDQNRALPIALYG
jgi:hypothetical protein